MNSNMIGQVAVQVFVSCRCCTSRDSWSQGWGDPLLSPRFGDMEAFRPVVPFPIFVYVAGSSNRRSRRSGLEKNSNNCSCLTDHQSHRRSASSTKRQRICRRLVLRRKRAVRNTGHKLFPPGSIGPADIPSSDYGVTLR